MPAYLLMHKKSQIKMLESIAVLLVFFFLFGFGLKFYGGIQIRSLEQAKENFLELDSIKISNLISRSAELRCTLQNYDRGSCVDKYKVLAISALKNDLSVASRFSDEIGFGTVTVYQIYPQKETFVIYDNVPLTNRTSLVTRIPVFIHDSVKNQYNFGVMEFNVTK